VLATVQQGGRARLQGGGRGYVKDLGFAQALALYEYIASPQPPSPHLSLRDTIHYQRSLQIHLEASP
jgi:hypothetical protein